jgi:hypothetical protein
MQNMLFLALLLAVLRWLWLLSQVASIKAWLYLATCCDFSYTPPLFKAAHGFPAELRSLI